MPLVHSVTLKAGPSGATTPLTVPCGTVTLFVGPNHSGKSLLLQEIKNAIPQARDFAAEKVLGGIAFNSISSPIVQRWREELQASVRELPGDNQQRLQLGLAGNSYVMVRPEFERVLSMSAASRKSSFGGG